MSNKVELPKLYDIWSIRTRRNKYHEIIEEIGRTKMAGYPMDLEKCKIMLSKQMQHKDVHYEILEAETDE